MEFVLSPSNHFIGIGPKLKGNTLHKSFVLRMDNYLLFELTHMLHRIRVSVIHGERGLMETPRELCLLYSLSKGGLGNLAQSFLHDVSSYPPSRWTHSPPLARMFLLTGIGLTRWSF